MRVALFIMAGAVLAACSSSVPSPSANPQTPNALSRSPRTDPPANHLTLVFKDAENYGLLRMNALPFSCIASVAPTTINLNPSKSRTVAIDAKVSDECAHKTAEVDFEITFQQVTIHQTWKGALDIWYDPEKSEWTAKTRGERQGGLELCTVPPGFHDGVRLQDNEQIDFSLC